MRTELDQPHHVTVGFVGEPGSRTFMLQAEDVHQRVTVVCEKAQVIGIADLLARLLAQVDDEPATDWDMGAMELREPIDPLWRVGNIQVGLDPTLGRFVLELDELRDDEDEPDVLHFSIDQDQARRLSAHGSEIAGQGRPRCELCGRPMARDGSHVCPSTNGHGH